MRDCDLWRGRSGGVLPFRGRVRSTGAWVRWAGSLAALLLAVHRVEHAGAQVSSEQAQRLPELGQPMASTDSAAALVQSPANLAFLPASELRWTGTFLGSSSEALWRGHALSLGLRLPLRLSAGARLDWVDPQTSAGAYRWLTWGMALRASDTVALGFTRQRSFSKSAFGRGLSTTSLGASYRPSDHLGFSGAVDHVWEDSNSAGSLSRAFKLGLVFRPLADGRGELGLSARHAPGPGTWEPRATLGIGFGKWGRLTAEGRLADPFSSGSLRWLASVGWNFALNHASGSFEGSSSVLGGRLLGSSGALGVQTGAASRGFADLNAATPGDFGAHVVIDKPPGTREHVALLRQLWGFARRPSVRAVLLELRAPPSANLAHAEELRDAVVELQRSGRHVACYFHGAELSALYLCSGADQVLMHPAGRVVPAGLSSHQFYFARLLDDVGVTAEVVRVGEHKSAPEAFTRRGASPPARAMRKALLQQAERQVVRGLATGRQQSLAQARQALNGGPYLAPAAVEAGLVDAVVFDDEVRSAVSRAVGQRLRFQSRPLEPFAPRSFGAGGRVALVYVDGEIAEGESGGMPLLGNPVAGARTLADALNAVGRDPRVAAIVLRVESPGGSSLAADVIWRAVRQLARNKPLVVSMGGVAASGGYYVSAPAARVFASRSSVTGSIGVFFVKADVSALLDKLGVDHEVYKTSAHADAQSPFRAWTPEERRALEARVQASYRLFLERVAAGRELSIEQVDAVGQGRVWSGEQALANGLVDELGGLRQALAHARRLAGLPSDAPWVELPQRRGGLFDPAQLRRRLLGRAPHPPLATLLRGLPSPLGKVVRSGFGPLEPWLIHNPDTPLMRLEAQEWAGQ